MYNYREQKKEIFTEGGVETLIAIRDNVKKLLSQAGAVRMDCATKGATGSSWTIFACVDRLVETGEIIEVTPEGTYPPDRVFVSTK